MKKSTFKGGQWGLFKHILRTHSTIFKEKNLILFGVHLIFDSAKEEGHSLLQ